MEPVMELHMEPPMEPPIESPKRMKFAFPFFRWNRDKQSTPQNAEVAQRKVLVEEGHRYLAEATDLLHQNRDRLYRKDPGLEQMLGDRWAELYGSAPSGKKLTKGRLIPEDFRDKSRALLADVQVEFENLKIEDESGGSSLQPHLELPPEEPPSLKRGQSVRREPSHRKTELRDEGPTIRTRDVQFAMSPQPEAREPLDQSYSSRTKGLGRHRDDKEDRHARPPEEKRTERGPRIDDRKPSEHSRRSADRPRTREEGDRRHRKDDRGDTYRDDRYRDDSRKDGKEHRRDHDGRYYDDRRDGRHRDDRYRDDRHKDGRYKDDRYKDDRHRDDRHRDDRYKDDRYRDDRRRDDRYRDRYRDDRYRDDRYRDGHYRDGRHKDGRYRDDRYYDDDRSRRHRDDRRRDDRRKDDHYYEDEYRERRRAGDRHRDAPRRSERREEGGEGEDRWRNGRREGEHRAPEHHHENREKGIPMSPTYISYVGQGEELHHRSSKRHREPEHPGDDHPQTLPEAEFVTDPEPMSHNPDSGRISRQSLKAEDEAEVHAEAEVGAE